MFLKWAYNIFIILGMLAMLAIANLSILIALFAPPPLVYTNLPFLVASRNYTTGDPFVMRVEQCSRETTSVAVVSVKELYNPDTGSIVALPPGSRIIPPGCTVVDVMFSGLFPSTLEEGTYFVRGVTTFRGKLGTIDVAWQTQAFVYRRSNE